MNRERAKQILLLHRPDVAADTDADVMEALASVERDEELRRWYETHRAAQDAIRSQFKKIAVPAALKEQILSERPWYTKHVTARHLVAVAAVVLVMIGLGAWWLDREPAEDTSFAAYRSHMISTALRAYGMQLETNSFASVRTFLKEHGAPADFVSPKALDQATVTGCLTVPWQGQRVSMICFKTGRPLRPEQSSDLWFFVVDHATVPDAPESETPQIVMVRNVTTASWSRQGKTYVLAGLGDAELLKKFL